MVNSYTNEGLFKFYLKPFRSTFIKEKCSVTEHECKGANTGNVGLHMFSSPSSDKPLCPHAWIREHEGAREEAPYSMFMPTPSAHRCFTRPSPD